MENSTTIISKKLGYHQILNINNKSEDSCYRFPFIWLSWLVLIFLLFDLDNIWKFEITLRKVNSTFINIHSIFQTDWNLSEVDFSS